MKNRDSTEKINKTKSWLPEPAVPCFQSLGATAEMDVEGGCPLQKPHLGQDQGSRRGRRRLRAAASAAHVGRSCSGSALCCPLLAASTAHLTAVGDLWL